MERGIGMFLKISFWCRLLLLADSRFITATMRSSTFSELRGPVLRGVDEGAAGARFWVSSSYWIRWAYIFGAVLKIILELSIAIADMEEMICDLIVVCDGLDMPACY